MPKVLHVLSDTNIGGAGRYLLNLLSQWDRNRFEVIIACPGGGDLEKELRTTSLKVYALRGGESSFDINHAKQLIKIINKEDVDIVHTHASLSGRLAGKISGCKVVLTRHSLTVGKNNFAKRLLTCGISKVFTHKIIAISRAVKINLIDTGVPADMIKIIHNGIDLSKFDKINPTLRRELDICEDVPLVGIVARLVPEKGYEYAIKALPQVLKKIPNMYLVIVGEGPLRGPLEELCRNLGVEKNVIFLGFRREVEALVADFDVFVLPSVREGLGLSLLEAMAQGKPVVATEAGGIPEIVKNQNNGLLVAPGNEEALAESIIEILSSKERASFLGSQAKKTVFEKFSAKTMAYETMKIYEEVLRKVGES